MDTPEELLCKKVARSKTRKRVKKRFPVLTFDRMTLRLLGVGERGWRGREVPRDAETRSLLLTAYLGLVVRNEPFRSWAPYLREAFPDVRPEQGDAQTFCIEQLRERQLLDACLDGRTSIEDALPASVYEKYLERMELDYLGDYHLIYTNVLFGRGPRVPLERRYLCGRCGLHFLASALFASADYGQRITHQLVWQPDVSWILGQTELGVYSIPNDSTGHGRAGMRLETYEQLVAITEGLFRQQVGYETPRALAKRFGDTAPRLKKELQRARQVLGMRRRRGNQTRWGNPEPCTECWRSMRVEALELARDGVSAMEIAGRIPVGESIVRGVATRGSEGFSMG